VTWSSTRFRATRQTIVIEQAADVDGVGKEFEKTKRGQEPISLKVRVPFFADVDGVGKEFEKTKRGQEPISLKVRVPFFADVDGVGKESEKAKRGQEPISLKVCVPFFRSPAYLRRSTTTRCGVASRGSARSSSATQKVSTLGLELTVSAWPLGLVMITGRDRLTRVGSSQSTTSS
jgi:hypothetical protein